jgi:branched-chain amino acid transport system ATP-binding protein
MLEVHALQAGYGTSQVLHAIDLAVAPGQLVTLMGRNGMGKTTTIRAIMGLLRPTAGHIRFLGTETTGKPPERIARAGIGLVPEGRLVFPTLTVRENLIATSRGQRWTLDRVYALFPRLAERHAQFAGTLSGGEQQMLAIGRALMTNPTLLILDEATEGLAPLIRTEIWRCIETLKSEGLSILAVDKNLTHLKRLGDRHFIVEKGRTVWQGTTPELDADPTIAHRFLGV